MSDVSKPTHTNEDKAKYDAEYERIFGKKPLKTIKNGKKRKVQ